MSAKKPGWDGSTKISEASTGTEAGSTLAWVEQSRLKEFNDQLESSLKLVGLSRRTPKRSKSMTQKRKGLHERHVFEDLIGAKAEFKIEQRQYVAMSEHPRLLAFQNYTSRHSGPRKTRASMAQSVGQH